MGCVTIHAMSHNAGRNEDGFVHGVLLRIRKIT